MLPEVSKIFEKLMNSQLSTYFEKNLSNFQCSFWKGFSTQHCLFWLTENWKHADDNSKVLKFPCKVFVAMICFLQN